jgi:hypothetical protein
MLFLSNFSYSVQQGLAGADFLSEAEAAFKWYGSPELVHYHDRDDHWSADGTPGLKEK